MQTYIVIILTSFQILFAICKLYLAQKNLKINIEIEKEIEKIEKKFGFKNQNQNNEFIKRKEINSKDIL